MSFYCTHDGVRYLVSTEVGQGLTRVLIEPQTEEAQVAMEPQQEDFHEFAS
jgi:hypothetical protein